MKRALLVGAVGLASLPLVTVMCAATIVSPQTLLSMPDASASQAATTEIPPVALAAYQAAAPLCPGLSWTVLAGIGKVETGHGTANGHHLDDTGQAVPSSPPLRSNVGNGALGYAYGPMQFVEGTWASYGPRVAPGGPNGDMTAGPIQNINSAAKAAALLLCSAAGGSITDDTTLRKANDAYSGSTDGYVDDVTSMAALYASAPSPTTGVPLPPPVPSSGSTGSTSGLRLVLAAIKMVGIP